MTNEGRGRFAPGIPDRASGGWLSPDGHYWACGDAQHPAIAERLVRRVAHSRAGDNPTTTLRRDGWCRVLDDGQVVRGDTDLTDAQRQA
jgi:hypothetical protein